MMQDGWGVEENVQQELTMVERICPADCQLRIYITHTRNGLIASVAYRNFFA